MKKLLSLALAATMLVFVFSACGTTVESAGSVSASENPEASPADSVSEPVVESTEVSLDETSSVAEDAPASWTLPLSDGSDTLSTFPGRRGNRRR